MKQIAYLVVDNGIDGRSPDTTVYCSMFESIRDEWFKKSPNKSWYTKKEQIVDLDEIALELWKTLNPVQKAALLNTGCPMWQLWFEDNSVSTKGLI